MPTDPGTLERIAGVNYVIRVAVVSLLTSPMTSAVDEAAVRQQATGYGR